jgi:hypothetical protein
MKLLTKKIRNQLPAPGSTKHIPLSEKQVICIFSNPIGDGDWYVFEGEEQRLSMILSNAFFRTDVRLMNTTNVATHHL